jgi:hypothetical protein
MRAIICDRYRLPKQDLLLLKDLIEAGKYRGVIDRRLLLLPGYVETEQKTGNVVLTVS